MLNIFQQGQFGRRRVGGAAPVPAVTWNPADKSANITLSAGDLTATCATAAASLARATSSKSTGKWYFEVLAGAVAGSGTLRYFIGVADSATPTNNYCGQTTNSAGYRPTGSVVRNGGSSGSYATWTSGDIISVAYDADTDEVWWAKNNTWISGDPAAGTVPALTFPASIARFPAISFNSSTSQNGTGRFKAADFTYSPPAGFSAWE